MTNKKISSIINNVQNNKDYKPNIFKRFLIVSAFHEQLDQDSTKHFKLLKSNSYPLLISSSVWSLISSILVTSFTSRYKFLVSNSTFIFTFYFNTNYYIKDLYNFINTEYYTLEDKIKKNEICIESLNIN